MLQEFPLWIDLRPVVERVRRIGQKRELAGRFRQRTIRYREIARQDFCCILFAPDIGLHNKRIMHHQHTALRVVQFGQNSLHVDFRQGFQDVADAARADQSGEFSACFKNGCEYIRQCDIRHVIGRQETAFGCDGVVLESQHEIPYECAFIIEKPGHSGHGFSCCSCNFQNQGVTDFGNNSHI